jgi:hypothetical protein
MSRALLLVLALLPGCSMGAMIAADPDAQRVEIGGDVFHVLIDGDMATVNNFSTGINNQLRLRDGARAAIDQLTDCAIGELIKLEEINIWQARLTCPPRT